MSEPSTHSVNELQLLEALTVSPETTQADLAARLGVAVGTVNWHLKRWALKGFVKIKRINRWRWSYLLTPEGLAHKARLASEYVESSFALYRRTRSEATRLLNGVRSAGYSEVVVDGDGEIADICRLTCLELGLDVVAVGDGAGLPVLKVDGVTMQLVVREEG